MRSNGERKLAARQKTHGVAQAATGTERKSDRFQQARFDERRRMRICERDREESGRPDEGFSQRTPSAGTI